MVAEADLCYQAGLGGPTVNVQNKLSGQEAGTGGHRKLDTEPVLPRFPPLLALQISVETLQLNEGKSVLLL